MSEPTARASRKCFEWLKWCLDNGWDKSALDDLQRLWWQYHDDNGEILIEPRPATTKQAQVRG